MTATNCLSRKRWLLSSTRKSQSTILLLLGWIHSLFNFSTDSRAANSRQTAAVNSAFSSLVISSSVLPELIELETPHLAENSYSLANSESSVQEFLSSRIPRPDYQPEDFIDFTLTIEIPDASTQATAAFFCMYPILLDLVRSACFDLAPIYFYQKPAAPFTKDDLAKTVTSANLRTMLKAVIVTIRLCWRYWVYTTNNK